MNAELERKLEQEYLALLKHNTGEWIKYESFIKIYFKRLIDDSARHAQIFDHLADKLEKKKKK